LPVVTLTLPVTAALATMFMAQMAAIVEVGCVRGKGVGAGMSGPSRRFERVLDRLKRRFPQK
jgi:hypothetical protein